MLFMKISRRLKAWICRVKIAVFAFTVCRRAKLSLTEALMFALVVFFGGIIGNWIVSILGLSGGDIITQALVFLIPVFVIYVIWKKWGEKAAASM